MVTMSLGEVDGRGIETLFVRPTFQTPPPPCGAHPTASPARRLRSRCQALSPPPPSAFALRSRESRFDRARSESVT